MSKTTVAPQVSLNASVPEDVAAGAEAWGLRSRGKANGTANGTANGRASNGNAKADGKANGKANGASAKPKKELNGNGKVTQYPSNPSEQAAMNGMPGVAPGQVGTPGEDDFLWMYTEEPHRSRRMAILRAHPEVRKLMGPTLLTPLVVAFVLTLQVSLALYLRRFHSLSLPVLLTAYVVGGTANQNTFLAIHEITHNLAFKTIQANKVLAIVANFAIAVPYAMAFKGYHIEHHKYLGEDGIDTDLPSKVEALVLNNVAGKTFFATFQLLFYALRPGFIRAQKFTVWHLLNVLAVLSFDAALVYNFGWRPVIYLLLSSFFAGSLHPCAAHFIAEHYLMNTPQSGTVQSLAQETTSYYGWLNILTYNVGYHNEHHDFPSVPWTRLPALRALAPEFYDSLPAHTSWPYVTYQFITDPRVGMWSRAKRTGRGEKIEEHTWHGLWHRPESDSSDDADDVSDSEMEREMDEAVHRGYASDRTEPDFE